MRVEGLDAQNLLAKFFKRASTRVHVGARWGEHWISMEFCKLLKAKTRVNVVHVVHVVEYRHRPSSRLVTAASRLMLFSKQFS